MNLGVGYSDIQYEDAADVPSLVDYSYANAFVGLSRALSENTILGFTINSTLLTSDDEKLNPDPDRDPTSPATYKIQNETLTNSLNGDLKYEFSENDLFSMSLGYRRSDYTFTEPTASKDKGDNDGYLFDFQYNRQFEGNHLKVTLGQFVDPNGAGQLTERYKFTFVASHMLAYQTKLHLALTATRIEDIQLKEQLDLPDVGFRLYSSANMSVSWSIARDWFMSFAYIFRSNHYSLPNANTEATARSNSGQLLFTYTPRKSRPYEIY